MPKYLSREGYGLKSIYNYYNVIKDLPVVIHEGPINATMVENSIALTGLKKVDLEVLQVFKYRYFMFDDDTPAREQSISLLDKGEYVFCWRKFIKDNCLPERKKWDINDFVIYTKRTPPIPFEELKPYFTNSVFMKTYFI
jgi:hypothetical protein